MISTGDMLREFNRLEREAAEVAYSRDEYLQLLFAAAVNLASGKWTAPNKSCSAARIEGRMTDHETQ